MFNKYDGIFEPWKVKLICQRARRMGFRGCDLDDAQQQVVLALLDFRFDSAKSNGATEATALTAVIDRQLAMIRRSEARAKQRLEIAQERCEEAYEATEMILAIDVASAIALLPELDQRICRELAQGNSINQLANTLGISWHSARAHIEAIRRHFEELGLGESFSSDVEATQA